MGRFILVSLGLVVVALSLSGVKGCCCPDGWLPMNGFCYKVNDEPKTWNDAKMFCRKLKPGCNLASIHSEAGSGNLAQYVSDYITKKVDVWIGLSDLQKTGTWDWSDRSPLNYLSWDEGEPNNQKDNEYCVELLSETGYLKWNDAPCESSLPFLCQCRL
ncbi:C-type lectin mannose-binding isoform-like [Erythrolamprus reginae]|uniref:C-type lectin mannose-binding isoform-like n=1 Tax=Erythrolamprus reginae TaxID=121349 RepID=UPI00396C7A02